MIEDLREAVRVLQNETPRKALPLHSLPSQVQGSPASMEVTALPSRFGSVLSDLAKQMQLRAKGAPPGGRHQRLLDKLPNTTSALHSEGLGSLATELAGGTEKQREQQQQLEQQQQQLEQQQRQLEEQQQQLEKQQQLLQQQQQNHKEETRALSMALDQASQRAATATADLEECRLEAQRLKEQQRGLQEAVAAASAKAAEAAQQLQRERDMQKQLQEQVATASSLHSEETTRFKQEKERLQEQVISLERKCEAAAAAEKAAKLQKEQQRQQLEHQLQELQQKSEQQLQHQEEAGQQRQELERQLQQ